VNERKRVPLSNERCQEPSVGRSRKRYAVVFCGDAEQVSVGFALALAVMEAHENLLLGSPESDRTGD
jgi:hypothetical protein